MKKFVLIIFIGLLFLSAEAQQYSFEVPDYNPSQENLQAREQFRDMRFGLFVHWGIYSVLGDGEWVMHNQHISYDKYKRLADFFYPYDFDAKKWVQIVKAAGMKYITITTRHHDGFSMFDTEASEYNIVDATPYGKDPLKELAEECKKEGIKLNFYYSLLDWGREDYGFGKKIVNGAPVDTDWNNYIEFMKAQLTELLTNYGEIGCIWFDGHWERKNANWHYDEIYGLIHEISPSTLIVNNHHMQPLPGEDIQAFERDLPGENTAGFSHGVKVSDLPLETCATIGKSWGFNLNEKRIKSKKEIIHLLVKAAGKDANLLLNVGPMPNGEIQPEFVKVLNEVGEWISKYGETIYETRGKVIDSQDWGTITQRDNQLFVHILKPDGKPYLFIPDLKLKVASAKNFENGAKLKFKQQAEGVFIYTKGLPENDVDQIIILKVK
ncbi:alpha-L-fucosidase [Thermophagus sp. OGC60D27]|uniref:alpha-L-fucosidase n=1 Tax=Thermophagus sp. OGC60D27 TaxID=3458415 RepID=UPI004037EA0D